MPRILSRFRRVLCFQTLLNCLDGVATQDGVVVVATANDPTCLDPAILKRPGRFDRVVHFRSPDASLRREYYRRLNPVLGGEQFESVIAQTEGFSFAELRETYIGLAIHRRALNRLEKFLLLLLISIVPLIR